MLRVFVRTPSLWLWPFFVGLGSVLIRGGMVVPWLAVVFWIIRVRARLWWWCVVLGACWGLCIIPASWPRLSWSAWVVGDSTARATIVHEDSRGVEYLRRWGSERLRQVVAEREATLATALLYGENSFSSKDKQLIRSIGLSHLTAVSGANLSFLLLFFLTISGWKWLPYRLRVWVQQGLILFFVVFTGAASSMVRAGIMASVGVWAVAVGRRASFLRSLFIAAVLIVLLEPRRMLTDLGWQFSLLACLGLSMASAKEERASTVVQGLRVSFWAWVWTLPVQLWRFQSWSWIGMVASVALTPTIELVQVGTVTVILVPHRWAGHLLQGTLSMVWGSFEYLASLQQSLAGASAGSSYLLLYIPLTLLLIHKNTQPWVGDVSSFSDTSRRRRLLALVKWGFHVTDFLDSCPDLVVPSFVSMLKTSARVTG